MIGTYLLKFSSICAAKYDASLDLELMEFRIGTYNDSGMDLLSDRYLAYLARRESFQDLKGNLHL